ncbi:MAG: hypothetical protein ACE5OY_01635 [Candidatus Bathyarchaeia archaeon]
MAIKGVGRIVRELKRRYDRKPKGWRFLTGISEGRYDMFISHDGRLWQIKTEPLSPYHHIGFGGIIARDIDEEIVRKMRSGTPAFFEMISPQSKDKAIIVRGIERYSSKSVGDLKSLLSPQQRKLDIRLRKQLDEIVQKKYGYRRSYIT